MAWFPFVLITFSTSAALEAIRIPGMAATREADAVRPGGRACDGASESAGGFRFQATIAP